MNRSIPVLLALGLVSGCANMSQKESRADVQESIATGPEAVRYERYTLASTAPTPGQKDLMTQIVDVTIPPALSPTVKDALDYIILRSGYTLCDAPTPEVSTLYTLPLPAAHYQLGPMTLRNTLSVLAGSAFDLQVDEVSRHVCFVLHPGYAASESTALGETEASGEDAR